MSDSVFLTTDEAAKRLKLAESTLEKMRGRGDGPPFLQLSTRRIVYDVEMIDRWARGRVYTSTSEYGTVAA